MREQQNFKGKDEEEDKHKQFKKGTLVVQCYILKKDSILDVPVPS